MMIFITMAKHERKQTAIGGFPLPLREDEAQYPKHVQHVQGNNTQDSTKSNLPMPLV